MKVPKEVEKIVENLPQTPLTETIGILIERQKLDGNALVYRDAYVYDPLQFRKRLMCKVTCTNCHESIYMEKSYAPCANARVPFGYYDTTYNESVFSGCSAICPICGEETSAIHVSAFGNQNLYCVASTSALSVHNVEGYLCVLLWNVYKYIDKQGNVFFETERNDGAIVANGKIFRVKGLRRNIGGSCIVLSSWELQRKFADMVQDISHDSIMPFDNLILANTNFEKSGLEDYMNFSENQRVYPITYLYLWLKYPNIENLIRTGYSRYINDVIGKSFIYNSFSSYRFKSFTESLDFKKVKPSEMLGLTKDEYRRFKGKSYSYVNFWKYIKNINKVKLSEVEMSYAEKIGFDNILHLLLDVKIPGCKYGVVKLINYLTTQINKSQKVSAVYLKDYWNMTFEVYNEVPECLLFPKDLLKSHDKILKLYIDKQNNALDEKIKKITAKYVEYSFSDDVTGLLIKPARSQTELIFEGKKLIHCVASYADSVAEGKTEIFFIRHIESPDTPFYTLEFKNGQVKQNRGYDNEDPTPEVIVFVEKWLKYIESINKKGTKKNGKRITESIPA